MATHDHSYKLLFSHPRMVQDLLEGFVKEPWVKRVDFSTLERCSGTYVADDLREREDDMVWRMRYGKEWVYLYLLLEFQSRVDRFMAVRVMTYVGLLYQDLIRRKEVRRAGKLPVVLPLVLYNGEKPWRAPLALGGLVQPAKGSLAKYRSPLQYVLLEERLVPKKALKGAPNLVALLFRLEQSNSLPEIQAALDEFEPWLEPGSLEEIRRAFAVWINRVVMGDKETEASQPPLNLMEVRSMLAERIRRRERQIESRARRKALAEGRAEGRVEALCADILTALETRFKKVPVDVRQEIKAITDEEVLAGLLRQAIVV